MERVQFTRILAATDLSEGAAEALRQADALARAASGQLAVVHVVPNLQGAHMLFPQLYALDLSRQSGLLERAADAVEESVAKITGRAPDSAEVFVDQGFDYYAEIVRRAASWHADLVVVGASGLSGLARLMLGSVAARVVRAAPCAVLVARPAPGSGTVLVATDLSDPSLPAIDAAAQEARRRGAKLVAMHVVDLGVNLSSLGAFGMSFPAPSQETLGHVRDAARIVLGQALEQREAQAELIVEQGPAATMILRTADALSPELIVVGTRGRTGISRVALGSVAERVLEAAPSPVLVVRLPSLLARE